mmetsp:Transcript_24025/g.39623  ORF Transcript_24025/g.39623 Transcript_24025/m.39623 type:complete len:135 (-) Transcript_24025:488-892(-)
MADELWIESSFCDRKQEEAGVSSFCLHPDAGEQIVFLLSSPPHLKKRTKVRGLGLAHNKNTIQRRGEEYLWQEMSVNSPLHPSVACVGGRSRSTSFLLSPTWAKETQMDDRRISLSLSSASAAAGVDGVTVDGG